METVQVQSTATMSPASRDELLKSFNSEAWLIELAAHQGVNINDIPLEHRQEMLACKSKNWVNLKFFAWYNGRPSESAEFTAQDTELFTQLISLRRSPMYERERDNLTAHLTRVKDYFKAAEEQLVHAGASRAKLHELEGTKNVDLTAEIKRCVADGWYKYNSELTKKWNQANINSHHGVVFTTPPVVSKFYNKKAGIELDVNLGEFKVVYQPSRNAIKVIEYKDNVTADGYFHPHITHEGNVCWGNAEETYISAMNECQPSRALLALRVILTNYNDESPYTDLYQFAIQRYPDLLEGRAHVYIQSVSEWILTENVPANCNGIRDTSSNSDGEEISYVRLWHKVYEGTNVPVDGEYENIQRYFKIVDSDNLRVTYEECDADWIVGEE